MKGAPPNYDDRPTPLLRAVACALFGCRPRDLVLGSRYTVLYCERCGRLLSP
jgi:hypothetical protein